jgi:DNA-binding NarL/FixJ family response regulator
VRARVLAADDNENTLDAIVRFLKEERHYVVGSAKNGEELVPLTLLLQPDIVVADVVMPEMNGLEALATLRERDCSAKFIVLTAHRLPAFVKTALASGASAYVLKHRMVADLPAAIDAALRGERFVSPPLAIAEEPAEAEGAQSYGA